MCHVNLQQRLFYRSFIGFLCSFLPCTHLRGHKEFGAVRTMLVTEFALCAHLKTALCMCVCVCVCVFRWVLMVSE